MTVRVLRYTVNDGKTKYGPGDLIRDLSEDEEQRLVESGVCEAIPTESKKTKASSTSKSDNE